MLPARPVLAPRYLFIRRTVISSSDFRAQFGEDRLLSEHFARKPEGVYVEVGAFDGVVASNTFFFEQLGWHGLLVEAVPELAASCQRSRPRSKVINCAVVAPNSAPEVNFEIVEGWELLSSISVDRGRMYNYRPNIRQLTVSARTLDCILEEANLGQIDFLTIDVEGYEWSVLQGFTISKWQPEIVILERWNSLPDTRIMRYMHKNNYVFLRNTGKLNDWFLRSAPGVSKGLPYRLRLFFLLYFPSFILHWAKRVAKAIRSKVRGIGQKI